MTLRVGVSITIYYQLYKVTSQVSLVTALIEQDNFLYFSLINKLQMVQNAAARVLTRTRKYDHISPVLSTLHRLPIKHCIAFKILLITYKALNGLAPQYLSKLSLHYSSPHPLRSQNSGHLIIPRTSKSTAGVRSFFYLAPKLWNNLPNTVREADTLCQFKSRLKTHLFNLAYT